MEKKKKQSEFYPNCLFLARDGEGGFHWYDSDPFKTPEGERREIDIAKKIEEFFGSCDMLNPIMIKIKGLAMHRCEAFAANVPVRIRLGLANKHLRDHEGFIVEILQSASDDETYVFNGVVMDTKGGIVGMRRYSLSGKCSDGNALHSLVVVDGQSPLIHEGPVSAAQSVTEETNLFETEGTFTDSSRMEEMEEIEFMQRGNKDV